MTAHYCYDEGLCVTVSPTEFICRGGRETGFVVGLVNYPRFPEHPERIRARAEDLARALIVELAQETALVQTPLLALWLTRRPDGSIGARGETQETGQATSAPSAPSVDDPDSTEPVEELDDFTVAADDEAPAPHDGGLLETMSRPLLIMTGRMPSNKAINDRIELWHGGTFAKGVTIPEVLGWSRKEYDTWVRNPAMVPCRPLPALDSFPPSAMAS